MLLEDQEALGRGWARGCPGGSVVSERRKEDHQASAGGRGGSGPGSGGGSLVCGIRGVQPPPPTSPFDTGPACGTRVLVPQGDKVR